MTESGCNWTDVAQQWGDKRADIEETNREVTEVLLRELDLQPGEQVLELAAGAGELAGRLSALVQPGGTVLATDVADGMVALIREHNAGAAGVEARQVDATATGLDSDAFDAVVMRMGLMLIADPAPAAQEIRRVLRPGGRFAGAVWGAPQANPWMATIGMAAMMHGLVQGPPPFAPGGPFSLHDPAALEKLLRGAGFEDVTVHTVEYLRHYESADEHFDMVSVLAPPIAAARRAASPEQLAACRETVGNLTAQFRTGDALDLPAQALVVIAR